MGSFPWGPHGPETSPFDVKPNPTAATTFPQLGDPNAYGIPSSGGSASAGGYAAAGSGGYVLTGSANPLLSIAVSLVMMPLVWMFWVCLYPLTAAIGLIAGALSTPFAFRLLSLHRDETNEAIGCGILIGYAVIVVVSRIEYRFAQHFTYRAVRHSVRLLLFGALALPWIQAMVFDVAGGSEMRYILTVMTHPRYLAIQLARPQNMAIVLAVIVEMHFLLWKTERLRAFWHRRLRWIGLK